MEELSVSATCAKKGLYRTFSKTRKGRAAQARDKKAGLETVAYADPVAFCCGPYKPGTVLLACAVPPWAPMLMMPPLG